MEELHFKVRLRIIYFMGPEKVLEMEIPIDQP